MPELTNSSVGSFAGTSELEDTTLCPLERKYSRKPVRISFDFIKRILLQRKKPGVPAGRPGKPPLLCVDTAVLQQPRANCAHGALVRRGELLKRAPGIEGGEELAVLVLAPRLPGLLRQLVLAALEPLDALQRGGRLVQRPHDLRPLVGAFRRKHLSAFR